MFRFQRSTLSAAMLFVAMPLAAQDGNQTVLAAAPQAIVVAAPAPSAVAELPRSFAPTIENSAVGVRAPITAPAKVATNALPQDGRVGRNPAMMIVGGVALIAGSFIDGDAGTIVMIAGGALGLYGLWQYLK